jgi:tetratricopeptide (TPR) repeat protein
MRVLALALSAALFSATVTPRALAQDESTAPPEKKQTPAQKEAEKHYKRARELYQLGRYREAIAQLEAALRLDPKGAELLYNLGLVHEKLGDADEAIDAYKRYLEVLGPDADPEEVAKIRGAIRRLEGAKSELKAREAKRTEHRFTPISSGLLVGAGVSLLATVVIGVQALSHDKQARDFVVRDEAGISQRQAIIDRSKSEATLANVFGALTVVTAGVGLTLYFTSEFPKKDDLEAPPAPKSALRVCPTKGGGTVSLEVAF